MSKESIKKMLEFICYYKDVGITYTIYSNNQPMATVSCIKNTTVIKVTNLETQTTDHYQNMHEAIIALEMQINSYELA